MIQSEATPPVVAGVCDPGGPRTAGLTEASRNAGSITTRAEKPACPCGSTPKPLTIFSMPGNLKMGAVGRVDGADIKARKPEVLTQCREGAKQKTRKQRIRANAELDYLCESKPAWARRTMRSWIGAE
jgi:hypothetical protein